MKTIKIGKVNDATVYAVATENGFVPLYKEDLEHCTPDLVIKCDSGAYPGVTDFESYICGKVDELLGEED